MQTLIVGDIHGCLRELRLLIAKAGLKSSDRLVAVGDMVDRGPHSTEVVDFLATRKNTLCVLGNHERKHVRWVTGETQPTQSQLITRHFSRSNYISMLAWFVSLPTYLELDAGIVVHAALEPGVALADQWESVMTGATAGEQYMRQTYKAPWYTLYRGRRRVFVGHRDYGGDGSPLIYNERVYGLDTGCYRGGWLTGIRLPDGAVFSVKARTNYWQMMQYRWSRVA
jgi:serine/threonine protein phosphatase 1